MRAVSPLVCVSLPLGVYCAVLLVWRVGRSRRDGYSKAWSCTRVVSLRTVRASVELQIICIARIFTGCVATVYGLDESFWGFRKQETRDYIKQVAHGWLMPAALLMPAVSATALRIGFVLHQLRHDLVAHVVESLFPVLV